MHSIKKNMSDSFIIGIHKENSNKNNCILQFFINLMHYSLHFVLLLSGTTSLKYQNE